MAVLKQRRTLSPSPFIQEYQDPWNTLHIDLDALKHNWRWLESKIPKKQPIYAVLKADAYGHGLGEAASVLSEIGCRYFAVESPSEGITLRNAGIEDEILLMNPIPLWMAEQAVRYDLSASVVHESILIPLEEAAASLNTTCRIHVNLNLGLNRMGVSTKNLPALIDQILSFRHLRLEGLFGQPRDLATAPDAMGKLISTVQLLKDRGIDIPKVHFANSITFLRLAESRKLGVRLGILLYGVLPPEMAGGTHDDIPVKSVMSLTSRLVQIQHLSAGSRLGYHAKERVKRDSVIGVIPLGYYHGLDRKMTRNGAVLIRGMSAPFAGAISMNASMVDITDISGVKIGEEVTLFGPQRGRRICLNELALKTNTIAAELMMRFGKSVPRKYRFEKDEVAKKISFREENEDIEIRYVQTIKELPETLPFSDIVAFLWENMEYYRDPIDRISAALDYALASSAPGRGFVLLAHSKDRLLGVLVSVHTDTVGFIPENIIVYVCVHHGYRRNKLGMRLIKQAMECTEGDIKLHVEKDNPAISLYKKMGFTEDYMEMRYKRRSKEQ
jgi:alanine racemase